MNYITKSVHIFRKVSLYSDFAQLLFMGNAPNIVAHVMPEVHYFRQLILGTAANVTVGTTNTALPASGVA